MSQSNNNNFNNVLFGNFHRNSAADLSLNSRNQTNRNTHQGKNIFDDDQISAIGDESMISQDVLNKELKSQREVIMQFVNSSLGDHANYMKDLAKKIENDSSREKDISDQEFIHIQNSVSRIEDKFTAEIKALESRLTAVINSKSNLNVTSSSSNNNSSNTSNMNSNNNRSNSNPNPTLVKDPFVYKMITDLDSKLDTVSKSISEQIQKNNVMVAQQLRNQQQQQQQPPTRVSTVITEENEDEIDQNLKKLQQEIQHLRQVNAQILEKTTSLPQKFQQQINEINAEVQSVKADLRAADSFRDCSPSNQSNIEKNLQQQLNDIQKQLNSFGETQRTVADLQRLVASQSSSTMNSQFMMVSSSTVNNNDNQIKTEISSSNNNNNNDRSLKGTSQGVGSHPFSFGGGIEKPSSTLGTMQSAEFEVASNGQRRLVSKTQGSEPSSHYSNNNNQLLPPTHPQTTSHSQQQQQGLFTSQRSPLSGRASRSHSRSGSNTARNSIHSIPQNSLVNNNQTNKNNLNHNNNVGNTSQDESDYYNILMDSSKNNSNQQQQQKPERKKIFENNYSSISNQSTHTAPSQQQQQHRMSMSSQASPLKRQIGTQNQDLFPPTSQQANLQQQQLPIQPQKQQQQHQHQQIKLLQIDQHDEVNLETLPNKESMVEQQDDLQRKQSKQEEEYEYSTKFDMAKLEQMPSSESNQSKNVEVFEVPDGAMNVLLLNSNISNIEDVDDEHHSNYSNYRLKDTKDFVQREFNPTTGTTIPAYNAIMSSQSSENNQHNFIPSHEVAANTTATATVTIPHITQIARPTQIAKPSFDLQQNLRQSPNILTNNYTGGSQSPWVIPTAPQATSQLPQLPKVEGKDVILDTLSRPPIMTYENHTFISFGPQAKQQQERSNSRSRQNLSVETHEQPKQQLQPNQNADQQFRLQNPNSFMNDNLYGVGNMQDQQQFNYNKENSNQRMNNSISHVKQQQQTTQILNSQGVDYMRVSRGIRSQQEYVEEDFQGTLQGAIDQNSKLSGEFGYNSQVQNANVEEVEYQLDENGFLLDANGQFLLDENQNQIQLDEHQIKYLQQNDMFVDNI